MTADYRFRWPHAIACALACGGIAYQTTVVLDQLQHLPATDRWGVPLATIAAALFPVLAEAAWREGSRAKAALLALPVFALIAFILPSSVSRLGEAQSARVVAATLSEAAHGRATGDLALSEKLVAQSQAWVAEACASGNGPKCRGQTFTLNQRTAYRDKLKQELSGSAPAVQPWLPVWYPALLPIGLELSILAGLFYGLGPLTARQRETSVKPALKPAVSITERDFAVDPITEEEIEEIKRVLGRDGLMNKDLARRMGVSEGQASRLATAAVATGKITKRVDPANRRAVIISAA